ncbi:MAG: hypothetical protein A2Z08_01670 [Deltaproteobacteria bacterium RBG_16_54_11]|jgi:hypothetical protein|nr:MAG: hypothetical protein A2Z08_01670 [Deltaproteobacteria bacterium RBG_16_54_11]
MKDNIIKVIGTALVAVLFSLPVVGLGVQITTDEEVPRITKEQLKTALGDPGIIILDVRLQDQWEAADQKIPGALHEDPKQDIKSWSHKYPKEKTVVLYCA